MKITLRNSTTHAWELRSTSIVPLPHPAALQLVTMRFHFREQSVNGLMPDGLTLAGTVSDLKVSLHATMVTMPRLNNK